ncbi:hypothetical protein [Clostridium butyricum]|uniref:hypothetical protein n=1 Tax=Clostridium butyricum TaxID=1492 RepID=UPI002AB26D5D|nr:hypothetical protein [Clostridium butyricum]
MITLKINNYVEIYNDGLLLIEGENLKDIELIVHNLISDNDDDWEVELLNKILYTINNNLSTLEVA